MPELDDDDFDYDEREAEWCDRCQGSGIAECHCGGDQCYCENYGEMECPTCHGEGSFVPTEAFKKARAENAKMWRELHESVQQTTPTDGEKR